MKRVDLANYIIIIGLILFFIMLIWSHYWNGPVVVEGLKNARISIVRPSPSSSLSPSPSSTTTTNPGPITTNPATTTTNPATTTTNPANTTTNPANTTTNPANTTTNPANTTTNPATTTAVSLESARQKLSEANGRNRTAQQEKTTQDNRVADFLRLLNTAKTNLATANTTFANMPETAKLTILYPNSSYTKALNDLNAKRMLANTAQITYDLAIKDQAEAVKTLETTAIELTKAQEEYDKINETIIPVITKDQKTLIDSTNEKVENIARRIVDIMGHVPASISDISISNISDIPYNENTKANNKANIDISMSLNAVPLTTSGILSKIFEDFDTEPYFPDLEIKTGQWNLNIKIPRGPRGEKGEKGDPGADGAKGAVGMEGDQGPRGERGA